MAYSSTQEKLFYFSGRVRAFWKDKIFFTDQRNAAVVDIDNLYLNGEKAYVSDLQHMDIQVANSDWDSAPLFQAYVFKYSSKELPPWPYKLKGKKLWVARYAWTQDIPEEVQEELYSQNVIYMPLTYYSGKLINIYEDKILFGDYRNSVMVPLSEVYFYGRKMSFRDAVIHFEHNSNIVIHAFMAKLNFLTSPQYEGPEPHLPTWPLGGNYGDTWVAKYAWQGEMPEALYPQINRFEMMKIHEWNASPRSFIHSNFNSQNISSFSVKKTIKPKGKGAKVFPEPLLVTTHKEAAIVSGSMLIANRKHGLMNSFLDVIVFSSKNFYINGELFWDGAHLNDFFHSKKWVKTPLTAWIVPLPEPILVFDMYVMWRAVCVWYGSPPICMEAIKERYDNGIIAGTVPQTLNTISDNRYTLVMGEVTSLSHNNGFGKAKVGSQTVYITFKRKAVYLYGYKIHSKCSLLENSAELQSGPWYMLIYPTVTENAEEKKVNYTAIAIWKYKHQHFVAPDLFYQILSHDGSMYAEVAYGQGEHKGERKGRHMGGYVVKCCPHFCIIESNTGAITEPIHIYCNRINLYIDNEILEEREFLRSCPGDRQVNLLAYATEYREIKGFPVTREATIAWIGKKPGKPQPTEGLLNKSQEMESNGSHTNTNTNGDVSDLKSASGSFQKAVQITTTPNVVSVHKAGRFVFLDEKYGVIRTGSNDFVLFDFTVLWINGFSLKANEGLYESIIHDDVQCNLVAQPIEKVEVGGFTVNMQASSVWLGRKPGHIKIPLSTGTKVTKAQENSPNNSPSKDASSYITKENKATEDTEDINESLANMTITVSKNTINGVENPVFIDVDPKKPYVGKHLGARIVKLSEDKGIAKWRSATFKGDVYILFERKNVYVKMCPMTDNFEMGQMRSANFLVIPTKVREELGYKVSLYATCGWIGAKPTDIPTVGQQEHSTISLDGIYFDSYNVGTYVVAQIVKLLEDKGIARWRSATFGGDVFLEFEKWDTCQTINMFFDQTLEYKEEYPKCHFYVVPIKHKEVCGYTVSLYSKFGWLGKRPPHFPKTKDMNMIIPKEKVHITPVDPAVIENEYLNQDADNSLLERDTPSPKEMDIKALDDVGGGTSSNSSSPEHSKGTPEKKKKAKSHVWDDETDTSINEGVIKEIHSNVGKLTGNDNKEHFFSREHCYLYGVNLSHVELWHVLVQDVKVSYRLSEVKSGEFKVVKLWVGEENIESKEALQLINEWCAKQIVPDGAQEILRSQLELSNEK